MSKLTEQLRARRRSLELSQTAAGGRCDPAISQQAICEIETGRSDPHLSTIERYAREGLGSSLMLLVDKSRPKRKPTRDQAERSD